MWFVGKTHDLGPILARDTGVVHSELQAAAPWNQKKGYSELPQQDNVPE
jgi:hypothetical protein